MPDPLETGTASATPNQTAKWPFLVFRIFALANFILAAAGLYFIPNFVIGALTGALGNTPAIPFSLRAFWIMTTINIVFLAFLILGGIRLLQLRTVGVTICNLVFVAEILYFISLVLLLPTFSTPASLSFAGATGVGNMGLAPQLSCWYPVIGLVALNVARRRLNGPIPAHRSMRSTASPSKLTAALMRILAVITLIQLLLSAWWMVRLVRSLPGFRRMYQFRHPHFTYLFSSLIFLNIALGTTVALMALSLWKLNKKSLFTFSGLLTLEWIFLIVAVLISGNQAERFGLAGVMSLKSFLAGSNGMLVIWSQLRTGFLFIAPVLIIATYLSRRFSRQVP